MVIMVAKGRTFFLAPWKFSEIMDVHGEMHMSHSCLQLAGKNINAIFLGVKNTF